LGSAVAGAEEPPGERFLDITRGGKPSATLVAPDDKSPVWDDAIAMITSTAKRWGGSPKVVRLGKEDRLPAGDLILLGTGDTSDIIAQRGRVTESPISRGPVAGPHGFAVGARTEAGSNGRPTARE